MCLQINLISVTFLTLICIHFQHQMNPMVLEWSCSLAFPLGMVNYNPKILCYFLVHIFFDILQKMSVLITGFVGRFWQSKFCPAITNPFQAQVVPSNRWRKFIFLLFLEWLSNFYATILTLHGKYVTDKTCWREFLISFTALISGRALCFQGGKTGISFSWSFYLWLAFCQDLPW